MASLNYNAMLAAVLRGVIDFEADAFACMLVTADYKPDKDRHATIADVDAEVRGDGYEAGGVPVVANVERRGDEQLISFSSPTWPRATITARAAIVYRKNGGELVGYVDFGEDVSATRGAFAVSFTAPLTFANRS